MNQELSTTEAKQRPILFSTPMVKAILEGRETQTRRIIKPQPIDNREVDGNFFEGNHKGYVKIDGHPNWQKQFAYEFCPYGKVGDTLYVRETWCWDYKDYPERTEKYYFYKADTPENYLASGERWYPSIHMPRAAARIFLKITGIIVERLQDITEEDAIAEGLAKITKDQGRTWKYGIPDKDGLPGNYDTGWDWQTWSVNPIMAFSLLWRKINGEDSWEQNPWTWKITFQRIENRRQNTFNS